MRRRDVDSGQGSLDLDATTRAQNADSHLQRQHCAGPLMTCDAESEHVGSRNIVPKARIWAIYKGIIDTMILLIKWFLTMFSGIKLFRQPRVGASHHGVNLFGERQAKCAGRTIFKRNEHKAKVGCIQIPIGRLMWRSTYIMGEHIRNRGDKWRTLWGN